MTEETQRPKDETTLKEAPIISLKGFCMGTADVIPGVSGGTIALIVGIYERLLNAINSVNSQFVKAVITLKWKEAFREIHLFFMASLFLGIFTAFAFFTRVVPLQIYMFTHPELIYGLFFGLILGSIYVLIKTLEKFSLHEFFSLLLGLAIGIIVVVILVPVETPNHPVFIFLSGAIAICAMILPGISGSYLLLIMRKYDYILTQIGLLGSEHTLDALISIIPFVLGCITGLAAFSRFLSWLLKRYHSVTIALLIGFMMGSLYSIWPFQHREFVEQVQTEIVDANNPRAEALAAISPNPNLPEYERLGRELLQGDVKKVEIERVSNKLIKSNPYIPGWLGSQESDNPNTAGGLGSIFAGFLLIWILEKFRGNGESTKIH